MQLIIESESIRNIKMSTLDEPQDKQNTVIADIKKSIQSIKDDLNKDGSSDAEKQQIVEDITNGDIETSNVNGTESPNDDKENDAPKIDMSLNAEEEESIENITNCVNSFFGLTEDSNTGSLAKKVDEEETLKVDNEMNSVQNVSAKDDDTKMEIDDEVNNVMPKLQTAQIIGEPNVSELNDVVNDKTKENGSSPPFLPVNNDDNVNGETCEDAVQLAQVSESPVEIETPEKMEIDPNSTVESKPSVDDSACNLDNTYGKTASTENEIPEQKSITNYKEACDDIDKTPLQHEVSEDTASCLKANESSVENTANSEGDISDPIEHISDLQTDTKNELDSINTDENMSDALSSEVKVALLRYEVLKNENVADGFLAPSNKDKDTAENEASNVNTPIIHSIEDVTENQLSVKINDTTEIDLNPCEKVNNVDNEISHDDTIAINSRNDIPEEADKINDINDIDIVPCEKVVNDASEDGTSHEDTRVDTTSDISNDKLVDNKNDEIDVDLVHDEKNVNNVKENNSSHEDISTDSTNDISGNKITDNESDDSSKEISPQNETPENLADTKSEDVADTSSIEQKEIHSTDIRPKESDKIENEVTKTPETKDKKEADSVSISSMEVDEIDIIPEKNSSENKEVVHETIELLLGDNNVIEIIDQDSTEIKTDKVDNSIKNESQVKDEDKTIPSEEIKNKHEIIDEDDIKIIEESKTQANVETAVKSESKPLVVCKLSNTLDILSDEDEEPAEPPLKKAKIEEKPQPPETEDKQCINLDDDDDIVLIEDTKESQKPVELEKPAESEVMKPKAMEDELFEKETKTDVEEPTPKVEEIDVPITETDSPSQLSEKETEPPKEEAVKEPPKPLLPMNVLKSAKKNLSEMTRDELEEFCILKIVESIVDRSSVSEIKKKMKVIEQNMEEYKKKALMLTKQNRDLQVVLKSVQEEQKNRPSNAITPLKITRSVGMQVLMFDKNNKKPQGQKNNSNAAKPVNRTPSQTPRPQRPQANNQNIPVPKLIPASPAKVPTSPMNVAKPQTPNGIRNTPSPAQKNVEKRPLTRQSVANTSNSMTVDLTDDDPPAKVTKNSPVAPVRLVPSQNLMAPRPQTPGTNPRKVFIPINGPGQTVLLKNLSNQQQLGPRGRFPAVPRLPHNQVRMTKVSVNRHPAPLPDVMKQYQPPTWKALPPAPDLKLSKVENGIVISWKIEGYQEDSYEKIASYQLYAYQETSTPPSTALWKKIGDVKALPLPMACTLTQFMAGFKYYFAVRAVDVKSRLGPFSLPGSILLLNKM